MRKARNGRGAKKALAIAAKRRHIFAVNAALAGIRVVELGQLVAGPFAGMILGYHGAEVIKIEPLGGDPLRNWRGMADGTSLWWRSLSRNKRCAAIDLHQAEGQQLVRKLIASADVLIENFRPGTLERWQLSPEKLREQNPGLLIARISGYGQTGPNASLPGYASACEAFGGFRQLNGMPGGPPIRPNLSLGDSLAGMNAAMGILLSLYRRDRNNAPGTDDDQHQGQDIDCAIYESVFSMLESVVPEYDRLGTVRQPSGTTITGIVPSGSYRAKDKYVVIGANNTPVFKRLCECLGNPELAEDPRYADNTSRVANQASLEAMISAWVAQHSAAEVVAQLNRAAVPCSTIYDVADMAADPHYQARGMFEQVEVDGRPLKIPALAPKLSATPGQTRWAGPDLGAHSQEILAELGVSPERYADLKARAIVR